MKNNGSKKTKRNSHKSLKVMLVGEGGQGIQTIATIFSRAEFKYGYHASHIPNFGTEQRGGISIAFVQVSKDTIISPKFKIADLFIIVSNRNIDRSLRYIGPHTNVIHDQDLLKEESLKKIQKRASCIVSIDAFKQSITSLTERSFNIILLGIVTSLVDPDLKQNVITAMDTKFKKYYDKKPNLKEMNHKALDIGFNLAKKS